MRFRQNTRINSRDNASAGECISLLADPRGRAVTRGEGIPPPGYRHSRSGGSPDSALP